MCLSVCVPTGLRNPGIHLSSQMHHTGTLSKLGWCLPNSANVLDSHSMDKIALAPCSLGPFLHCAPSTCQHSSTHASTQISSCSAPDNGSGHRPPSQQDQHTHAPTTAWFPRAGHSMQLHSPSFNTPAGNLSSASAPAASAPAYNKVGQHSVQ